MPTSTPWGLSQAQTKITRGINSYTTASHGGYILSKGMNLRIPEYARIASRAYEEDCDWSIVVTFLPEYFPALVRKNAKDSLRTWHPDVYERRYGEVIPAGMSYVKDKQEWERDVRENNRFVVKAAWGSWHETVPAGFVGVKAAAALTGAEAWFLVPESEYKARDSKGFVIDLDRHGDWVGAEA